MKLTLSVTIIATLLATALTQVSDPPYAEIKACPGFDNSPYVTGLNIEFDVIPTSGTNCKMTATGLVMKDHFDSYAKLVSYWNGVQIFLQNKDWNREYKTGQKFIVKQTMPIKFCPAGIITGKMEYFDEMGTRIQCWSYTVTVRTVSYTHLTLPTIYSV